MGERTVNGSRRAFVLDLVLEAGASGGPGLLRKQATGKGRSRADRTGAGVADEQDGEEAVARSIQRVNPRRAWLVLEEEARRSPRRDRTATTNLAGGWQGTQGLMKQGGGGGLGVRRG